MWIPQNDMVLTDVMTNKEYIRLINFKAFHCKQLKTSRNHLICTRCSQSSGIKLGSDSRKIKKNIQT